MLNEILIVFDGLQFLHSFFDIQYLFWRVKTLAITFYKITELDLSNVDLVVKIEFVYFTW